MAELNLMEIALRDTLLTATSLSRADALPLRTLRAPLSLPSWMFFLSIKL